MLNKNSLAVKNVRGQSEATMVISDQNPRAAEASMAVKEKCASTLSMLMLGGSGHAPPGNF